MLFISISYGITAVLIPIHSKIKEIKDDIAANDGVITEAHIKEAGKAVQDELVAVRSPVKNKLDELQAEYDASDIKRQIEAAEQKKNAIYTIPIFVVFILVIAQNKII